MNEKEKRMRYRIFVVEDDQVIAAQIVSSLKRWGYDAVMAEDLSDILPQYKSFDPHLTVMDVSLPYYNGLYWCQRIREQSGAPVMFLSSRAEGMDVIMGVNMGGDDYVAKPVSMDVLVAKISALLRRSYDYECTPKILIGEAVFDPASCTLALEGEKRTLTRNEARILQLLWENRPGVVSRERLMQRLWDSEDFVDDNTLTVNINRLRKTLEGMGIGNCIQTHKGQGYALDA